MVNDKVDIVVRGRKLTVEMEGLSQLEVNSLANLVDERMRQIEKDTKTADSSKLAIMTALDFAAELEKLRSKLADYERLEERKIDGMIVSLEKALEP